MKKAKSILLKLFFPPKWVIFLVSLIGFGGLIWVFASKNQHGIAVYTIYGISAYALSVVSVSAPKIYKSIRNFSKNNRAVVKLKGTEFGGKYFSDISFRGSVSIYQGMAVNFLYVVFRFVAGAIYASTWFISMAVYYFVLGILRVYLISCYNRKNADRRRCYRNTAWLLFVLNIPMGGMILLMIKTNSGYTYPGYIIYVSAMYTFYIGIISVVNLVKFRRLGDPVLSAAKVLNLVSAMMSILGLQTAMISAFSKDGEGFRKLMNTITGTAVYGAVIVIAVYMIIHSRKLKTER